MSVHLEASASSLQPSIGTCRRAGTDIAMKRELGTGCRYGVGSLLTMSEVGKSNPFDKSIPSVNNHHQRTRAICSFVQSPQRGLNFLTCSFLPSVLCCSSWMAVLAARYAPEDFHSIRYGPLHGFAIFTSIMAAVQVTNRPAAGRGSCRSFRGNIL